MGIAQPHDFFVDHSASTRSLEALGIEGYARSSANSSGIIASVAVGNACSLVGSRSKRRWRFVFAPTPRGYASGGMGVGAKEVIDPVRSIGGTM